MFWGTVIKEGKPFKSQQAMQDKEFSALHISQATLPEGCHQGKIYLTASMGKELPNLTVAVLSADKDTCALDFYINLSQNVTLSVKGKSEVHLTGYMEPSADEDGMMMGNPEEMDYDSEDDELEEQENGDKDVVGFKGNLKEAKKNSQLNAKTHKKEESDSDDDLDEEEYDDEDEEELDSDLMQEGDMDESEEAEVDEEGRFEELSDSDEDDKKKSQTKKASSTQKKPAQQVKKEESEDEEDSDEEDDDEKILEGSDDDDEDDSEEETGLHDLLKKQR